MDEQALYDALRTRRIGGAVIDAWYAYPTPDNPRPLPSALPFHELPSLVTTPHMSGWTEGTLRRRQRARAENVRRRRRSEPCPNVVRDA